MKFSVKNFFSKCEQICSFLRIWSHSLKKSLMENFIFCAVMTSVLVNLRWLKRDWITNFKKFYLKRKLAVLITAAVGLIEIWHTFFTLVLFCACHRGLRWSHICDDKISGSSFSDTVNVTSRTASCFCIFSIQQSLLRFVRVSSW